MILAVEFPLAFNKSHCYETENDAFCPFARTVETGSAWKGTAKHQHRKENIKNISKSL